MQIRWTAFSTEDLAVGTKLTEVKGKHTNETVRIYLPGTTTWADNINVISFYCQQMVSAVCYRRCTRASSRHVRCAQHMPLALVELKTYAACTSLHAYVGFVGSLSFGVHDVAGRVTIVDDCSFKIENFKYDGLAPDARV